MKMTKICGLKMIQLIKLTKIPIFITLGFAFLTCEKEIENISENNEVESIIIESAATEIKEMLSLQLVAKVNYKNNNQSTILPVIWKSSDPKIAFIEPNGLVTALSEGRATITAMVEKASATHEIEVIKNNIKSISFIDLPNEITVSKYALLKARVVVESGDTIINPKGIRFSVDDSTAACIYDGRLLGIKQGNVKINAIILKESEKVNIYVNAVEFNEIPISLSTPAFNSICQIPVIILRYLPTADGINLDVSKYPGYYGLDPISLKSLQQNINEYDQRIKFSLEEGTRFRGYKITNSAAYIGYKIIKYITIYEHTPKGKQIFTGIGDPVYLPNYHRMFERLNIENYINEQGAKEIWIWDSAFDESFPSFNPYIHNPEDFRMSWESNMSSPLTADISNSDQDPNDLPIYKFTYTVYGQNFRRTQAEAIHNRGHQYERLFTYAEVGHRGELGHSPIFWQKFVGKNPDGSSVLGRCGWTHMPPNTTKDYDYLNKNLVYSDIEDWKPDNSGERKMINVDTWSQIAYNWPGKSEFPQRNESQWYIYWMQNIPGYKNKIPLGENNTLTNWWVFVAAWDDAITKRETLFE